jgi:hypothetical protein
MELIVIDNQRVPLGKAVFLALDVVVDGAVEHIHYLVTIVFMKMTVKFVVALDKPYRMMKIKGFVRGFVINEVLSHIT